MGNWTVAEIAMSGVVLGWTYPRQHGPAIDFTDVRDEFLVQYEVSCLVGDNFLVALEMSLDGTGWGNSYDTYPYIGWFSLSVNSTVAQTVTGLLYVTGHPARFVRVGGDNRNTGSPVVSALVAARSK
jgi:hypothetical protein